MAANSQYAWGDDLVFTYGPLGFLKFPTYWYDGTGRLAALYSFGTTLALLAVLWALSRRSFGAVGAFVLLFVIARDLGDAALVLPFAIALWLILKEPRERNALAFAAGMGTFGGLELLGKTNTGAVVVAAGAVAIAFLPPGRRLKPGAVLAGSTLASLMLLWLIAGQSLGALPDHVLNTVRIVSGYSAAMGLEDAGRTWQYSAVLFTLVAGAAGIWLATELRPLRVRAGALALWLVFSFMLFKQGFVRHHGHETIYFAAMVGALMAVPWGSGRRALAGLGAIAIPLLAFMATTNQRVDRLIAPGASLDDAASDLATIFDADRRKEAREAGRRRAVAALALAPGTLEPLRGRTVAVEPSESDAAWVYRLRWKPLPVMHSNVAYGSALDELEAAALAAADAPERILWRLEPGVDRRLPSFDPPAMWRAMLCRYTPLGSQPGWIVVGRGPNRCGPERRIGSARAAWGEPVPVPTPSRPDAMVFVRVHGADVGGLERLRSFLFKARFRWVILDGTETRRLVAGTADDGLLISAPAAADYPEPFALAPNVRQIAIRVDGGGTGGQPLRYDFFEAPMTGV
jgi:hypothetical protein